MLAGGHCKRIFGSLTTRAKCLDQSLRASRASPQLVYGPRRLHVSSCLFRLFAGSVKYKAGKRVSHGRAKVWCLDAYASTRTSRRLHLPHRQATRTERTYIYIHAESIELVKPKVKFRTGRNLIGRGRATRSESPSSSSARASRENRHAKMTDKSRPSRSSYSLVC